jgi:hypothetical protein
LNTPLLLGAILAWGVRRPCGNELLQRARGNRGTLIASGLIAGGALAGVLDAAVKAIKEGMGRAESSPNTGYLDGAGNWIALLVMLGLAAFVYFDARPQIQM